MDLVAADALILINRIADQMDVTAAEMTDRFPASLFLFVVTELRDAEQVFRNRVRMLATYRNE